MNRFCRVLHHKLFSLIALKLVFASQAERALEQDEGGSGRQGKARQDEII
jgi:hypothetical protein